jgi:hypothetical protein
LTAPATGRLSSAAYILKTGSSFPTKSAVIPFTLRTLQQTIQPLRTMKAAPSMDAALLLLSRQRPPHRSLLFR